MPSRDRGRRDFDKSAGDWERDASRLKMTAALADAVIAGLAWDPGFVAMDYGAGTGLVTLRIQPLVGRVVAVDTSSGMLGVLEKKVLAAGLTNVSLRIWDVEKDPLLEDRFDIIVSTMTFHHLGDIPAALARFRELLNPGGRMAVADLDAEAGDFHADPTGVRHFGFDRGKLKGQFEAAGFSRVRTATAHRLERPGAGGTLKEFSFFLLTTSK
jgi:ubiquinone/menaquinone biosynthesis C-methylase UbiE